MTGNGRRFQRVLTLVFETCLLVGWPISAFPQDWRQEGSGKGGGGVIARSSGLPERAAEATKPRVRCSAKQVSEEAPDLSGPGLPAGPELSVPGFLDAHPTTSSVPDGPATKLEIRRARVLLKGGFGRHLSGVIQPDFGGGTIACSDAKLRIAAPNAGPEFVIDQVKLAFDVFDLMSITEIDVIEPAGAIFSPDTYPGVGGLCSYSKLNQTLGYAGYDIWVGLDGNLLGGGMLYQATGGGYRLPAPFSIWWEQTSSRSILRSGSGTGDHRVVPQDPERGAVGRKPVVTGSSGNRNQFMASADISN